MTTFVFTDPSGRKHKVTGPEGATQEQAFEILQQRLGSSFPIAGPDEAPAETQRLASHRPSNDFLQQQEMGDMGQAWRDLMQGGKSTLDRTALGIKELLPQSVQDAGDAIDRVAGSGGLTRTMAAMRPKSGYGTAGAIAADVALGAAPLGFGAQAARFVGAPGLVGDVLGAAAYGLASTPENRQEAAMYGAAGAGLGHTLVKTLGSLVPRAGGPALQALEEAGVHPSIGQAAQTRFTAGNDALTALENTLKKIPFAGHGVKRHHEYTQEQLKQALANPSAQARLADLTKPGPYEPGMLAQRQRLEELHPGLALGEASSAVVPGLRTKTISPQNLVQGTPYQPGFGEQVGAAGLGLGAYLHLPLTSVLTTASLAAYSRPIQLGLLKMMKASDTVSTFLARNPSAAPVVTQAILGQLQGHQEK